LLLYARGDSPTRTNAQRTHSTQPLVLRRRARTPCVLSSPTHRVRRSHESMMHMTIVSWVSSSQAPPVAPPAIIVMVMVGPLPSSVRQLSARYHQCRWV
jgi:hypothetical protein